MERDAVPVVERFLGAFNAADEVHASRGGRPLHDARFWSPAVAADG